MTRAEQRVVLPEVNSDRWLSLENFAREFWRVVPGYEDRYIVSNYGRVKSLETTITNLTNPNVKFYKQKYPEKILRQYKNHDGYWLVTLCKNGKAKGISVHRLVGIAFLDNRSGLPMINHKDESRTNNYVCINEDGSVEHDKSNLEWCDNKYNCNYGKAKERMSKAKSKQVQQYSLDGTLLNEFASVKEASIKTGLSVGRICDCCNRRKKSVTGGGYFWKYKDSDSIILPRLTIKQFSKEGELIKVWDDVASAAISIGLHSRTGIYNCISGRTKTAGGYIWKKD